MMNKLDKQANLSNLTDALRCLNDTDKLFERV